MEKNVYYTYLGETGIIISPIVIPGAFSVKKYELVAEEGKRLTKDNKHYFKVVMIPASEIDLWAEVPYNGQN